MSEQFTRDDLSALNAAIKGGVLQVSYPSGQMIRYQKLDDMLKLRQVMIGDLNKGQYSRSALANLDINEADTDGEY